MEKYKIIKILFVIGFISINLHANDFMIATKAHALKQYDKSLKYFVKSYDNNNMNGCDMLGYMYSIGDGVNINKQKAI